MRTMRDNLKLLDGLARTAGTFTGLGEQVKQLVRERLDEIVQKMDLVPRAEFERVEAIALRARERQEQLEKRLSALERGGKAKPAPKKAPAKKKGAKK